MATTASVFSAVLSYRTWPASVYVVLLSVIALFIKLTWQPSFPKTAPKLVRGWPVIGSLRLFQDRANFFHDAIKETQSGNFSMYFGKHQIVGVTGLEGRKTFFESKDLSMSEGYAVLFTHGPSPGKTKEPGTSQGFATWFNVTITKMLKKENFVRNLKTLTSDAASSLDAMVARNGGRKTGVMNPFDDMYRMVYLLTMRTVGATEIAESPELLAKTLGLFEQIERSSSPARVILPWLPTPNYARQMYAGSRLYMIFDKIIRDRKATGRREEDALQFLMDTGEDIVKVLSFVLGALFAGQINSGINAAWLFCYLACNAEWYSRVQSEVDASLARHRTSPSQTPAEVLSALTLDEWESDFPAIDLCLRECIRFQLVGTAFRKNIGGRDIPIGKTSSEIIPEDAFSIFLMDDVHMNPDIYTEPQKWDPSRYLPDRAEDKKVPLGYLGWGIGRHPCLGMRFAKMEMGIIGALFVAMFDFELCDEKGNKVNEAPWTDRNRHSAHKPAFPMRLRYTVRQH